MRTAPNKAVEPYRIKNSPLSGEGNYGAFAITTAPPPWYFQVIISDGGGWDHVSVCLRSSKNPDEYQTPSWSAMCYIKSLFFSDDETVVQFHPKKSEYVNCHPCVLHLWRNQAEGHALPPKGFV
jgi:hypothetical protein